MGYEDPRAWQGNPKPWVNMGRSGFERRAGDDDRNQADQVDLDLLADIWGGMLGGTAGMFYGNNRIKAGSRSNIGTRTTAPIRASSIITRTYTGSSTTPTQTCAIRNGTPSRR